MKAAIYARKSKDTQKGESTKNQIDRGIDFCKLKGWDYEIFEDFDISGKTLDRPAFHQMMEKIYDKKIQALICYKLDRVSRSVNDFSSLIQELDDMNVSFISLKENFDTSTPMGRAMMMITSVFAQLERETIAERVRDSMHDRAKKGLWNGGKVPYGYTPHREKTVVGDKTINKTTLTIDEEEAYYVKYIFKKGSEGFGHRSISFMLQNNGVLNRGEEFTPTKVRGILSNPFYCISDKDAYEYFSSGEFNLVSDEKDFNSDNGLLRYNRKTPTGAIKDKTEWIISVAEHKGLISGSEFVRVQNIIESKKRKPNRVGTSMTTALGGLVRCECGSSAGIMYARKGSATKNDPYTYCYFGCRSYRNGIKCENRKLFRVDYLESACFKMICDLFADDDMIEKALKEYNQGNVDNIDETRNKIKNIDKRLLDIKGEIDNVFNILSKNILPEELVKEKYNKLENEQSKLLDEKKELTLELNQVSINEFDIKSIRELINEIKDEDILSVDLELRKRLFNSVIKQITISKDSEFKVDFVLCFDNSRICKELQNTKIKIATINASIIVEKTYDYDQDKIIEDIKKYLKRKNMYLKDFCEMIGYSKSNIQSFMHKEIELSDRLRMKLMELNIMKVKKE